jgi:alkanesulfonate monooxygenase SsuD/methylene tetrahydromethanopterin reductase-like flavin-dependent oxidoreductase (luciferase family)
MSLPAELGVVLPARTRPAPLSFDELLRIAEDVDANHRWGQLWVPDSILALPFYESTVLLAASAARTRRVQLGVSCLASLGLRHPVIVAQQWANLDALSGGRMILVACPGNATGAAVASELRVFGLDYQEKVARFEEYVDFLRQVSAAEEVDFSGRYLQVSGLSLRPAFVQRPLPIWVVGNPSAAAGPKTLGRVLGRVARLGSGWMTYNVTPDTLRTRVEYLADLRAGLGQPTEGFPVCTFVNANVNPDERQAYEDVAAKWSQQSTRNISVEDLQQVGAIGSPARCADFIARLVDAGTTHIALELLATDPHKQLELLSEHLLPLLPA